MSRITYLALLLLAAFCTFSGSTGAAPFAASDDGGGTDGQPPEQICYAIQGLGSVNAHPCFSFYRITRRVWADGACDFDLSTPCVFSWSFHGNIKDKCVRRHNLTSNRVREFDFVELGCGDVMNIEFTFMGDIAGRIYFGCLQCELDEGVLGEEIEMPPIEVAPTNDG